MTITTIEILLSVTFLSKLDISKSSKSMSTLVRSYFLLSDVLRLIPSVSLDSLKICILLMFANCW